MTSVPNIITPNITTSTLTLTPHITTSTLTPNITTSTLTLTPNITTSTLTPNITTSTLTPHITTSTLTLTPHIITSTLTLTPNITTPCTATGWTLSPNTSCPTLPDEGSFLMDIYLQVCLASGVYLSILSLLTVLSNGVLLFALYKDPLNHKDRHPLTILIMGLASADLFTGFAVDPFFAYVFFQSSFSNITDESYNILLKVGTVLSGISMNVSFLVVLCLSWAQLFAIIVPHKQKQVITRVRTNVCMLGIWLYSVTFSLLNIMGVPKDVFLKLDVYIHLTAVQIIIIVSYVVLCIAYKRHLSKLIPFLDITKTPSQASRALEQHRRTQKQLVLVNIMLTACLICFVLPVTIIWYITLYWTPDNYSEYLQASIASIIVDSLLYLKFLLDPFIYGWRLPKFRRAVVAAIQGRRISNSASLAMISKTTKTQETIGSRARFSL